MEGIRFNEREFLFYVNEVSHQAWEALEYIVGVVLIFDMGRELLMQNVRSL